MLTFVLLGQPVLLKNGAPLRNFRSQKEAALLIYLAQTGQTCQREFIAELLWDSRSTRQALTNLRTALARLRKQVAEALVITRTTLALAPDSQQQVDSVNLLQTLSQIGQIDAADKAHTLQKALEAYRGAFLTDFHLADAPLFEEWVLATRAQIHRQVTAAYGKLAQYALSAGDHEFGLTLARHWLTVDALNETAHTLLIRLLIERGNRREAMAHYTHAAHLLKTELDVEPSAEMLALRALIEESSPHPLAPPRPANFVRHNLPVAHDQFFGRQTAQQEIHTRLDQPWCRLVTLTGQGGVGKTRLATTIARSRLSQYPDGVWLVALADIDPADEDLAEAIAVEIATVLDLRLTGSATPVAQLLDHLQHKQMMLVLDNFEHLLAGLPIILDIITRCEQVQLIVTSREALRLKAEWAVPLTGLSYPTSDADEIASAAVDLFVARRAQQQRGAIAEDDLAAIRQICRLVAGLPLAIELAAALTRHTPLREMADSLRNSFDVLTTTMRDVPERHRGLQIVFEMSWRTLTPDLQQQLARLSVFRGGFTATAVAHITHAAAHHLTTLIDKSLLTYQPENGRYTLHPVIRAYAATKRAANDPTPHKHAHYYLTLLAQQTEPLQKEKPQESMRLLEPDIDNIRHAWQTGLSAQNTDLLLSALTPFSIYYQLRGLAHEGESVMHSTMSNATSWDSNGIPLAARAGLERARFQNRLGQYRPAIQTIQTTLKLAEQCADRWAEGMAHVWWGESLWRLGDYDVAKEKLTHALDSGQALDTNLIIGWCHHQLGIIHDIQGRYDMAQVHLEKACAVWGKLDDTNALSVSLNSIGLVFYHKGDLLAAQQAFEQTLSLCNQIENRHLQTILFSNLSIIATELNDFMGAQYYLKLSLEFAANSGDLSLLADSHINLGRNYNFQGEFNLAIDDLEKGLHLAKLIGNRRAMAIAALYLAETSRHQKKSEEAFALYEQAIDIAQQDGLQWVECESLMGLAQLYSKPTQIERAKNYCEQAVLLAEKLQNPQLLQRAKNVSMHLESAIG
ncbi:MAG: tetratricopeptide repeat protein [Candidatus Promineifilaceae bacterium]